MKLISTILLLLVATCNTGAQKLLSGEHKDMLRPYPIGKYLMTIQEKGKETKDAMMTAVEINKNNELIALQADGEEPEAIAQLQFSEDKINIQFIPFLADLSGDYKIKYKTHGVFSLNGTKKTITLFPFELDEIGNREMGIVGKWKLKGSKKNLTIDFQLPNKVRVTEKKGHLTLDEYYFWGVMPNGEDIFITASPFYNPFGGYLRQIQVKSKVLHFDYKGKHYVMSKM